MPTYSDFHWSFQEFLGGKTGSSHGRINLKNNPHNEIGAFVCDKNVITDKNLNVSLIYSVNEVNKG